MVLRRVPCVGMFTGVGDHIDPVHRRLYDSTDNQHRANSAWPSLCDNQHDALAGQCGQARQRDLGQPAPCYSRGWLHRLVYTRVHSPLLSVSQQTRNYCALMIYLLT